MEPGETVFSDAAKGTVNSSSRREGGLLSIECELPSIPGQSGSPVVNTKGELIGVVSKGFGRGRWSSISVVKMLDPVELRKLIEADRKKH